MSTIEEIRKRVEGWAERRSSRVSVAEFEAEADQAQQDRATLLAALDGEWQSDIPSEGQWHLTVPHDIRSKWGAGFDWPMEVAISVGGLIVIHNLHYNPRGIAAPMFTGALWQRRTVPGDPFAKGGGK